MKRLVWISVAMLICIAILGYGLYTMRHIEEINQRRRQQDAGSEIAMHIASTIATTDIWDRLRQTETSVTTETGDAAGETRNSDPFASEDPNAMLETTPFDPNAPTEMIETETADVAVETENQDTETTVIQFVFQ